MTQDEFTNYEHLFGSDGWRQFIKSVGEIEDAITKGAVDSVLPRTNAPVKGDPRIRELH